MRVNSSVRVAIPEPVDGAQSRVSRGSSEGRPSARQGSIGATRRSSQSNRPRGPEWTRRSRPGSPSRSRGAPGRDQREGVVVRHRGTLLASACSPGRLRPLIFFPPSYPLLAGRCRRRGRSGSRSRPRSALGHAGRPDAHDPGQHSRPARERVRDHPEGHRAERRAQVVAGRRRLAMRAAVRGIRHGCSG